MSLIEITPDHWIDPDEVVAVVPGPLRIAASGEFKTTRVYLRDKPHYVVLKLTPAEVIARIEEVRAEVEQRLRDGFGEAMRQPQVIRFDDVDSGGQFPIDPRHRDMHDLRVTQMKAAAVRCCDAGRRAYPEPCPYHGGQVVT